MLSQGLDQPSLPGREAQTPEGATRQRRISVPKNARVLVCKEFLDTGWGLGKLALT